MPTKRLPENRRGCGCGDGAPWRQIALHWPDVVAALCRRAGVRTAFARRPLPFDWKRSAARSLLGAALFLLGVAWIPYLWCSRDADAWYGDDMSRAGSLARGVEQCIGASISRSTFTTGSSQFNGEWLFGTYLMAGLGFGQCALQHAAGRERCLAGMRCCISQLLSPEVRAFDRETWGADPLETLDSGQDHAAYLGYLNLLLSLHRRLDPHSEYAALNDRITAALVRRIEASPTRLIQSYPHEVYPVDNCAAFGSIGLHALATATDRPAFLREWSQNLQRRYIDPKTGLLYQAVDCESGRPFDQPRGSGTTLAAYFLSFADARLSRDLYRAVRSSLFRTVFGFGGVREYPVTVRAGRGDIDSGPVVFGLGLSPTGFAIAGSRMHGDRDAFRRLFATAYAWGAPVEIDGRLHFVTGGPLGDSILFAMLTACTPQQLAGASP